MAENRDPAVEAARAAWALHGKPAWLFDKPEHPWNGGMSLDLIASAREALAPIRSRHRPLTRHVSYGSPETERVCVYCLGPVKWPCLDAIDAYSTEELLA